ncbi:Holliday junction resolvase RecU [Sporosarcina gallistercoris]|uniref:Holliday junction resolvase RecU n=1 Tax=Sporosarcina gallistercoris TaxID=2762245 RepID=A0ABR8PFH7_9BACL|nr:Holliday junction resolvase RecU [Sporosarcina gallistercoris]
MVIRYPNGKKYIAAATKTAAKPTSSTFSNRGKTLEDELNDSNEYYTSRGIAVIHKKPVPIQIVNVRYPARSAAVITEAYFKTASTTDYNGVWQGKYVDFEAKETKNKTSFPLQNIHDHQVAHMSQVHEQGGIAFLIIRFSLLDRYFVVPFKNFIEKWKRMTEGGRKSITLDEIVEISIELQPGYQPRLDYLQAITGMVEHPTGERTERQES